MPWPCPYKMLINTPFPSSTPSTSSRVFGVTVDGLLLEFLKHAVLHWCVSPNNVYVLDRSGPHGDVDAEHLLMLPWCPQCRHIRTCSPKRQRPYSTMNQWNSSSLREIHSMMCTTVHGLASAKQWAAGVGAAGRWDGGVEPGRILSRVSRAGRTG